MMNGLDATHLGPTAAAMIPEDITQVHEAAAAAEARIAAIRAIAEEEDAVVADFIIIDLLTMLNPRLNKGAKSLRWTTTIHFHLFPPGSLMGTMAGKDRRISGL
jgi:hypothetical protein